MTLYSGLLASNGVISTGNAIICIIAMMSSFGPTAALSALSNNLNQTLASGNRVLNLLAEEPVVMDVESNVEVPDEDIRISNVTFTYPEDKKEEKPILKNFSLDIRKNTIHGPGCTHVIPYTGISCIFTS